MKSKIPLLIITLLSVSFAFKDSDLDGVEDSRDKCPGTPILVLVDKYGCPLERPKGRFYLRVGGTFSSDENERRAALLSSVAYYYERFYLSLTTRYYVYSRISGSGMGDTTLYGSYRFPVGNLYLIPGLRVRIPTGADPFTDGDIHLTPSMILDLFLGRIDVFLYGSYTIRFAEGRRNTYSLSLGSGYDVTKKLYVSVSYDTAQSSVGGGNLDYLSTFLLYDITRRIYTTLSYSYGLDERSVDHSLTFRVGLRF